MISLLSRKTNTEPSEVRVFQLNRDSAEGIALAWLFAERRTDLVAPATCTQCDTPADLLAVTVAVGLAVVRIGTDRPGMVSSTFNSSSCGGVEVEHRCPACGHIDAMTHSAEIAGAPRLWQESADNMEGDDQ